MTKLVQSTATANTLAKLKTLFGPPPVLGSEDPTAYDGILAGILADTKARDFIQEIWVKNAADALWEIKRVRRHKALLLERQVRQQQEMDEEREEAEEVEQLDESTPEGEKVERADNPAEEGEQLDQGEEVKEPGAPTTQFERMVELDAVVGSLVPDCDAILAGPVDELKYAAALESNIDLYERLDRLEDRAVARLEDALNQLDLYRQGLGSRSRRVSDAIIEGEFSESTQEPVSIPDPNAGGQ